MLTYENFVAVLLTAIEQADLNIAYTQELLDTHALGRSLSITCLPQGVEDDRSPEEPPLRAVIAFRWSPEFTVFSLRGGPPDSFDGIVDERILATPAGVGLEIDISYTLPLTADPLYDLAAVPQIARAVHELYASAVPDSQNPIRVEQALAFPQGQATRIKSLTMHQSWPLGDALFDTDLLSEVFEELCSELCDVLEALAEVYLPDMRTNHVAVTEADDLPVERRYLKPPTA
jgi:hypothetical protein